MKKSEIPSDWTVYRIIRFRRNGRPRTIRNNVTLREAQRHCSDPKTRKEGVWFDGYDLMPNVRCED